MFKKLVAISKFLFIFLFVAGWIFSGWPKIWQNPQFPPEIKKAQALTTGTGDGLIIYGQSGNTTPQWRTYSGISNTFGAALSTVASSTGRNFVVQTAPTKQEAIAGYVTSGGVLQVMCYDGTSWTNEWSATVGGTGDTRRFDIAYESSTSQAMVVYSGNVATTTNALRYQTKAGTSGCGSANWSGETNLSTSRTSSTVKWVRLERDPRTTSTVIGLGWLDANGALSAREWTGSSWGVAEPSAAFVSPAEFVTAAGDSLSFDIAFESNTGNLVIVFSPNNTGANKCTAGTDCMKYSRYTTSWLAATAIPTLDDPGTNIDLSANPNTNELVLGAVDNNSTDLGIAYWSGSAWTGFGSVDISTNPVVAGSKIVASGWLTSATTTRYVVIYSDSGSTAVAGFDGFGTNTPTKHLIWFSPTPALNPLQYWFDIQTDPFSKDRIMLTVSDGNSDLFAKRMVMDAAANFTWTNADGGTALEANLPQATSSPSFFDYWNFIPPPTYTLSAYLFFRNYNATFTMSPFTTTENATATLDRTTPPFRLRLLLNVSNGDLGLNGQQFKLQFAGMGGGTCASPSGGTPSTYTDVTTSTVIAFRDNPVPADGAFISDATGTPGTLGLSDGGNTILNETYEEANNFTNGQNAISDGQDGGWDFALTDNGAPAGTTYCFRVVKSDNSVITYSVYPTVITASPTFDQTSYRWFSNDNSTGVGAPLAAEDATTTAPSQGTPFRLRMLLYDEGKSVDAGNGNFKLQVAPRGTDNLCDAQFSGESYSDVSASTGTIRFYDNTGATDGASLTATSSDPANFYDDFSSYITGVSYNAGDIFNLWQDTFGNYLGYQMVTSTQAFEQKSRTATSSAQTYSIWASGPYVSSTNLTFKARVYTEAQLRTGSAPNGWETAWVWWNRSHDTTESYYFLPKTDGWELGGHNSADQQFILAFGSSPTFPINNWYNIEVDQTPGNIKAYVSSSLIVSYSTSSRMYTEGRLGLYNEDAQTLNDNISVNLNTVDQTYKESNNFSNTAAMTVHQASKWDFSLVDNSAPASTPYCFRVVKSDGSLLDSYTDMPQITTATSGGTVSCSTNISSTSFGTLTTGSISTASANASTTMTCSNALGCTLNVQDAGNGSSPGLSTSSPAYLISSVTATLSAGTEGYGIQAATTTVGSDAALGINSTYLKTGNNVGALSLTNVVLASSTAPSTSREVVVTHKAAISNLTNAASYKDTITYSCVGN